jgi:tetratricopeptide (TPR) repeat protein
MALRERVRSRGEVEFDFGDRDQAADVLYALSSAMFDDCQDAPDHVLSDAAAFHDALSKCRWKDDEIGERETILCSLAFSCWRAARLLARSIDSQQWEEQYRLTLRGSAEWSLIGNLCQPEDGAISPSFSGLGALNPEELFRFLLYLRDRCDTDPQMVSLGAIRLYRELSANNIQVPSDLRLFFLGESARLAGATVRNTGVQEEASDWLDVAASHFRVGPNREPELARVSYLRLAILYRLCRFEAVYRSIPALAKSFRDFGMQEDLVKSRILWAASLKSAGECERALAVLEPLRHLKEELRPALYAWVLVELGDISQILGDYRKGFEDLEEAARLFRAGEQLLGLADVAAMIGFGLRSQGKLREAAECFQGSQEQYRQLGVRSLEAYAGILLAETYIALGSPHEAERLLLAAVPIFEEQGMIADAVAAVALLRESIRQQKLDPKMLRDLRERLR